MTFRFGVGVRIRLLLVLTSVLVSLGLGTFVRVLPWALLTATLDIITSATTDLATGRQQRAGAIPLLAVAGVVAGISYPLAGVATAPLLLVPCYHGGRLLGRSAIAYVCGAAALAGAVTVWSMWGLSAIGDHKELPWLLGGIIFTLLGAWSLSQSGMTKRVEEAAAQEASQLLRRLQAIADSSNTGFDAPSLGSAALDLLDEALRPDRSALVVAAGGAAIPLSLRGATRFPWADPMTEHSPLAPGWQSNSAELSEFDDGRRQHHLVTAPLYSTDGARLGLLVADRAALPFSDDALARVEQVAQRVAPQLEAALLFARLREGAALEERSRLAREMHDGLAQDLAALAYEADTVVAAIKTARDTATPAAEHLQQSLRSAVIDMRSQIADLRMMERPDRTLGALISGATQVLTYATGARTTVTLRETRTRFPADVELALHRIVATFLQDAGVAHDLSQVELDVLLSPPVAELHLHHNGTTALEPASFGSAPWPGPAPIITVTTDEGRRPRVHVTVGSAPEGEQGPR